MRVIGFFASLGFVVWVSGGKVGSSRSESVKIYEGPKLSRFYVSLRSVEFYVFDVIIFEGFGARCNIL